MAIYNENSNQHSDGSDTEVIIKPKRTRRKKELPLFSSMQKKEGEKNGSLHIGSRNIYHIEDSSINYTADDIHITCPYTKYIPLDYLLVSPVLLSEDTSSFPLASVLSSLPNGILNKKRNVILKKKREQFSKYPWGIKGLLSNLNGISDTDDKNTAIIKANEYLSFDRMYNIGVQSWGYNRVSAILDVFKGIYGSWENRMRNFQLRIYNGNVSRMSIYINDVPQILAVILPENYVQMKLELLLTERIDLRKVIVLVNRELDDTLYPIPAFRSMYKKHLEPFLKEVECDVWKVPLQYIQESCFVRDYVIDEINIVKKKKAIDEHIEKFIEKMSLQYVQEASVEDLTVNDTLLTIEDDNYDDNDDENEEYIEDEDEELLEYINEREQQLLAAEVFEITPSSDITALTI